jgi:hypothetical protein
LAIDRLLLMFQQKGGAAALFVWAPRFAWRVAARRGLRGPIIQSLNYLIATARFTSSVRTRWRIVDA